MKKQTEGRAAKGGMALRRALAGALAVLMLCTAVPVYAQAPADASQAASSQAAAGAGSAPVQEGTAGGDASSVPGQGAASEAPEAPSEGDASEPTLPAEEEPSEDASAPAQEAGTASSEQAEEADAPVEQAAEPAPQAASDAEAGGEATAAQTSTSLPVAGQSYWFQLDGSGSQSGSKFTEQKLRPHVPMALEWAPFTFSGTIDAYVLNQASAEQTDSSNDASASESAENSNGYHYKHQIFLSDHVLTDATSWNTINSETLIFGKEYEVAGITYTGRAPTGGVGEGTTPLDNSEYQIMQKSGHVKNPAWTASLMQDTGATDLTKAVVRGDESSAEAVKEQAKSEGLQAGLRPVLAVKPEDEGKLHAVSLDLGGFRLKTTTAADYKGGEVSAMNVVAAEEGDNVPRPTLEQLVQKGGGLALTEKDLKWEDQSGKQYGFNDKIPVKDVTSLKLVTDLSGTQSTNLPVAGETYWFNLDGTTKNTTGVNNAKEYFPAGLKWVPMTFSGTIDAYVLNVSARGKSGVGIQASKAHSPEECSYGYVYPHQIFLANLWITSAGYNPNWIDQKGDNAIYGKPHQTNGIVYTLRSPSGGDKGGDQGIENSEWDTMLAKGYIPREPADVSSATQDYRNNMYIFRQNKGSNGIFFDYIPGYSSSAHAGWRPLLEVPQGEESALHAVALDFGSFKLKSHTGYTGYFGEEIRAMNVVMAENAADITRPAYAELAWAGEGEAPSEKDLIWMADNGRTYAFNAKIPVTGITKLTLGVREKDTSGMGTPGITITQQPQNATIWEGEDAAFTVGALSDYGVGTLSYTWEVKQPQASRTLAEDGWQGAAGANSYVESNVPLAKNGTQYRCKVTLTYTEVGADGTETQKTIEIYSNAATLTVKQPHTVKVNNGTGGGKYAAGESVTLTAEDRAGYRFTGWTLEGVTVKDTAQKSITFTMPEQDVTATANYEELFTVTVNGGTGGGQYAAGDRVTLTAEVPAGHKFDGWMFSPEVSFLDGTNAGSATVVFTMPEGGVTAKAVTSAQASNTPAPAPGASGQKPNPKTGVGA